MTLLYEAYLDILKMYLHSKNEVLGQCFQKLEPEQDKQTRPNVLPCRIPGW